MALMVESRGKRSWRMAAGAASHAVARSQFGRASALFLVIALSSCGGPRGVSPPSAATPEEQAYLSQIEVSGANMMVARNFLGDAVITLDAKVTNHGQKAVRYVELQLRFMDLSQQKVVFQTTARPITLDTPPLKAGETRAFSLNFEQLPDDWNQGPPEIKPVRVVF